MNPQQPGMMNPQQPGMMNPQQPGMPQQPNMMNPNMPQNPNMRNPMNPNMPQQPMNPNMPQQPMNPNMPQQPMNPNMQRNPNMPPQQMGMYGQPQGQPAFKLLGRGQGIDQREYDAITKAAMNAYMMRMNPLSGGTSTGIKQMIGGEWFVFVCPVGVTNFDFSLSIVTGGDFLSFSVDNFHFQVCRLRD